MPTQRAPIDRFALGRRLTRIANASVEEALAGLIPEPATTAASRIGITGPPGAGKSSLIARLARRRLDAGKRVGVIAVDPTSPFTSGAILGDRIRMEDVGDHAEVFIRSLASRGSHDGLADNLSDILLTMDAFDFDEVLVETVGVGQVECAIRTVVDTTVLVLNPQSGDQVQAMKAGILEAADVIVVNKADLPGADRIAAEVQSVMRLRSRERDAWEPTVLMTSKDDPESLVKVESMLFEHLAWAKSHRDEAATRHARRRYHLSVLLARHSAEIVRTLPLDALDAALPAAFRQLIARLG